MNRSQAFHINVTILSFPVRISMYLAAEKTNPKPQQVNFEIKKMFLLHSMCV